MAKWYNSSHILYGYRNNQRLLKECFGTCHSQGPAVILQPVSVLRNRLLSVFLSVPDVCFFDTIRSNACTWKAQWESPTASSDPPSMPSSWEFSKTTLVQDIRGRHEFLAGFPRLQRFHWLISGTEEHLRCSISNSFTLSTFDV